MRRKKDVLVKGASSIVNITIHPERYCFVKNESKANSISDMLKFTEPISGPVGIVQRIQWCAGKCLTTSSPNVVLTWPVD